MNFPSSRSLCAFVACSSLLSSLASTASAQPAPSASAAPPASALVAPPPVPSPMVAPPVLSAPVPPAPVMVVPSVPASPDRCSPADLERTQREAARFVVKVYAPGLGEPSLGVVVGDTSTVLTSYNSSLAWRSTPTVYFADGEKREAVVERVDFRSGLALLRVASPPASAAAVVPRPAGAVGTPVLGVGEPLHKKTLMSWSVVPATVSVRLEDRLGISASLPVGAPVLSCDGSLLGIQIGERAAVDAIAMARLRNGGEDPEGNLVEPSGWLPLLATGVHLTGVIARQQAGLGLHVGMMGARWRNKVQVQTGLGMQWFNARKSEGDRPAVSESGFRYQLDATVGYRFHIEAGSPPYAFAPIHLVPVLGVALRNEVLERTSLSSLPCGSTTCPVSERLERLKSVGVDPLVGLSINLAGAELMYQFQLNLKEPKNSLHTLGVGVSF